MPLSAPRERKGRSTIRHGIGKRNLFRGSFARRIAALFLVCVLLPIGILIGPPKTAQAGPPDASELPDE